MSNWHYTGKQVLQDGRHFADAAGELEAMMIVNAMRALDHPDCPPIHQRIGAPQHRGGTVAPPERLPLVGEVSRETVMCDPLGLKRTPCGAIYCHPRREGDEYVCSKGCGVRWDVRESAPRCGRAVSG